MEDLIKKAVQVKSIEDGVEKVTILEEPQGGQKYPTKYTFFKKKANSEVETKAYEQFKELEVEAGKVYQIAIKETKGTNKMSGKEITYRNIMFFVTGEGTYTKPIETAPRASGELKKRLDNASKAFVELDKRLNDKINALDLRLSVLELEANPNGDSKDRATTGDLTL